VPPVHQLPGSILSRILVTPSGCWEWQGARHPLGYGYVRWEGKRWYAHRLVYTLTVGPIPHGLLVLHHCDNPPCCNPTDLYAGTQADNMRDMVERNRWGGSRSLPSGERHWSHRTPNRIVRGEAHGQAKITAADVRDIRASHDDGESLRSLARRYKLSRPQIKRIVTGQAWAHVKEDTVA